MCDSRLRLLFFIFYELSNCALCLLLSPFSNVVNCEKRMKKKIQFNNHKRMVQVSMARNVLYKCMFYRLKSTLVVNYSLLFLNHMKITSTFYEKYFQVFRRFFLKQYKIYFFFHHISYFTFCENIPTTKEMWKYHKTSLYTIFHHFKVSLPLFSHDIIMMISLFFLCCARSRKNIKDDKN